MLTFGFQVHQPFASEVYLDSTEIAIRKNQFDQFLDNYGLNNDDPYKVGDVVGNGGGYLEGLIQYQFDKLEYDLRQVLSSQIVEFMPKERKDLIRILNILATENSANKLRFIKQSEFPGFFGTQSAALGRTAITGFTTDYPIFINIEQAYIQNINDSETWKIILIHELGHQLGISSHSYLNALGGKVARVDNSLTNSIHLKIKKSKLSISTHNFYGFHNTTFLTAHADNVRGASLYLDESSYSPFCRTDIFSGLSIENMHVEKISKNSEGHYIYQLNAWINIRCLNPIDYQDYTIQKDLYLELKLDKDSLEAISFEQI